MYARTTTDITLDLIRSPHDPKARKTKIFCTLGPACWSVEGLVALIDAGMNVARFNFSHGDHASHGACLERLRAAMAQRPESPVGILLDTKGPEIRTGVVDPSCGGKVKYNKGDIIEVGTDYTKGCTSSHLACSYPSLPSSVKVGGNILVADGSLLLEVTEIKVKSVMAKVLNNASFGDKKNMNLPGCIVDLPTLTPKDCDDLVKFGVANGVDFIAASFVRKASDIDFIRQTLGPAGKNIKIIAKIENQEGMENFDAILEKTDGIMVARGDLGMEIPIEKVFLAQKWMIAKCNAAGKPVCTATQMLESMITNPRPTRAECADVANAVLDGTDNVMLSGETANGEFSADAVTYMSNTCYNAEQIINNDDEFNAIRHKVLAKGPMNAPESVASSAVKTAIDLKSKLIITLTESGTTARQVAKYRPPMPVRAFTTDIQVARQMNGYMKGIKSTVVPSFQGTDSIIDNAIKGYVASGLLSAGDTVVACYGAKEATSGSASTVRVITV
eukprot:CAMPEP_0182427394 /NCGR_PEP_ID=MMETSP1167-20130531/17137_1 /TAXON_ID=2988 /ORGANISM="Mallomonas Sp, Strain CCMP3275" /LENGTH=502 /DNA_ID=CAMNT_0024609597 /DNA_START=46 /DNA_END=1554 /DNA_ORIENTATION=+